MSPPNSEAIENEVAGYLAMETRIARACADYGRRRESVHLVCVSKNFAAPRITPVLDAGQRLFGENRVQEAQAKWPMLKERYPGLALHLIGPLQTNKVGAAVALFDALHSLDRPTLARALADEMARVGKTLELFVQVNIGDEPQKAGVSTDMADAFIQSCPREFGLEISGLMCIPPVGSQASPFFAQLRKIAERNGVKNLSMGMSDDFELAIQLGATHVRVGSAIFGARPPVSAL